MSERYFFYECILEKMHSFLLATLVLPSVPTDASWGLLDLLPGDVRALRATGLDEACSQRLRQRFAAAGLSTASLTSSQSLQSFADANAAYNATVRAMGIVPSDRASMARCAADGASSACAWVVRPLRDVCVAPSLDEATLKRVLAPPRLAWWVLRGMSAFLLPPNGPVAAASRRRLGLLDGDAQPQSTVASSSSLFSEGLVQRIKDAVTDVAATLVSKDVGGSSGLWTTLRSTFASRRLGLWSSQSVFHDDSSERLRAFVHSAPTLRTDSQRAAAERALAAAKRALMQFGTSVYFELPASKKMLVAQVVRGDEQAIQEILSYLKTTKLAQAVRARLGFTKNEVAGALAFASGSEGEVERAARTVALRVPSIDEEEREALARLLAAAQPSLRALCVAIAWVASRVP